MKRGRRRSGGWQITMDAALERSPAGFRHVGDGLVYHSLQWLSSVPLSYSSFHSGASDLEKETEQ